MGATSKAKPQTKVVEREIVTPERQETTTTMAAAPRMAGETFLSSSKRYNPVTTTTTTPGSVVREREEVPVEATQPKFESTGNPIFDLILQKRGIDPGQPRSR